MDLPNELIFQICEQPSLSFYDILHMVKPCCRLYGPLRDVLYRFVLEYDRGLLPLTWALQKGVMELAEYLVNVKHIDLSVGSESSNPNIYHNVKRPSSGNALHIYNVPQTYERRSI